MATLEEKIRIHANMFRISVFCKNGYEDMNTCFSKIYFKEVI